MTENGQSGWEHSRLEHMICTQTVFAAATRWKHFPMGKGGNFNKKLTNFKIVRKKRKKNSKNNQKN